MTSVLTIMTGEPEFQIRAQGGTRGDQGHALDWYNAGKCDLAVVVSNRRARGEGERAPHRTAFLLAKVANIVPVVLDEPDTGGSRHAEDRKRASPQRYFIRFEAVARINVPNAWPHIRNPISYNDLSDLGIDLAALEFEPLGAPAASTERVPAVAQGSSMPETAMARAVDMIRQELASRHGVDPDSIGVKIVTEFDFPAPDRLIKRGG